MKATYLKHWFESPAIPTLFSKFRLKITRREPIILNSDTLLLYDL
jgi:hypothetical protein